MPIAAEKTIEMIMEFGETRVGQPMSCEIPIAEPTPSAKPRMPPNVHRVIDSERN